MMEWWNGETLEHWSSGVIGYRSNGVLECWSDELRKERIME
jgi:hypothetical protein